MMKLKEIATVESVNGNGVRDQFACYYGNFMMISSTMYHNSSLNLVDVPSATVLLDNRSTAAVLQSPRLVIAFFWCVAMSQT